MNKSEALKKIDELKKFVEDCDRQEEFVSIGYDQISKETFDKYGAKPFQIMKRKMRKDGKVCNNITWKDAKAESEKLGYRLPSIQEMLVLLDAYKAVYPDNASIRHKEFLGIEELSYDEDVYYEWIDAPSPCARGGPWNSGGSAGAFALNLGWGTDSASGTVGFRFCR